MMKIAANTKIVMVHPSRGWTSGMYEVLGFDEYECSIRHIETQLIDIIYTAHLVVNLETVKYEKQWRKDRAAKIGKRK